VVATKNGAASFSSPQTDRPLGDYQEIISEVLPSVVTIWVETDDGGGNGSGWVISSDGYIVTNHHVAALAEGKDAKMSVQFSDGREVSAEVVGSAKSTDIAVIKVEDVETKALPVANSDDLAVGDPVVAIGAPLGLSHTVTDGIISALDRPVSVEEGGETTVMAGIQTDAAINPGNSGGPLFDAGGQVIGVNTLIYAFPNQDGEAGSMGLGFAISSNQASRVAEEIIDNGSATKTVLGTELAETKSGDLGAKISDVASDTPAADAGLKDGDVITKFNDTLLTSDLQLMALVLKHAPGDKITLSYERDGADDEVQVELSAAKDD
jgi:putative serine protease PepD